MNTHRLIKFIAMLFPVLLMHACTPSNQELLMYVGTYTGTGSEGIYAYRFNPANGEVTRIGLVAKTDNPSFLAIDSKGKFLYAVNELDSFQNESSGAVSVFSINKETAALELIQQIPSLGAAPCHVTLDKSERFLLVANYNGGNAVVFPVESDGKLGAHTALIQNVGSSVNAARQTSPHAHFIQTTPDNRHVMIADLGIDQIVVNQFDAGTGAVTSVQPGNTMLTPGAGPRHVAFSPSGNFMYVLNELTSTINVFELNVENGSTKELQSLSALPPNFSGANTTAEITIDATGKFLYASNRGDNSIGMYSIDAVSGTLTAVEWVPSGGKDPRHFIIDPTGKWLIAANQNSDNLVIFQIDQQQGQLIKKSEAAGINSPVCVKFLPLATQ
jgi:6-phosphogluconolactonase